MSGAELQRGNGIEVNIVQIGSSGEGVHSGLGTTDAVDEGAQSARSVGAFVAYIWNAVIVGIGESDDGGRDGDTDVIRGRKSSIARRQAEDIVAWSGEGEGGV